MGAKTVLNYVDARGREPFHDWLKNLRDTGAFARITNRLLRVAQGNMGDCAPVGGGVWEFRFHFGPGYRVYFGQDGTSIVVLLAAGDKSTQSKDILIAQARWRDYLRSKP